MLTLNQIKLPSNILLVEEHPVTVQETIGGVHRDPQDIAREKAMRVFRTGTVISEGIVDKEILSSFSTKGEGDRLVKMELESLIGKTVMYMVSGIDIVDVPVEDTKRLVSINAAHLYSLISEE